MGTSVFGRARRSHRRAVVVGRAAVAAVAAVAAAVLWLAFAPNVFANVPLDETTSGNGAVYLVTDSTVSPDLQPTVLPATVDLGITNDDQFAVVAVPFTFRVQDQEIAEGTQMWVSSNGIIVFDLPGDLPTGVDHHTNKDMAVLDAANGAPFLAPFWDDLNPSACSNGISYGLAGDFPERIAVVEWDNVCDIGNSSGDGDGFSFSAYIYEATGIIEYHYFDVDVVNPDTLFNSSGGRSATVGVSAGGSGGAGGANGAYNQYSFNREGAVDNNFAIRFTPCSSATVATTAAQLDTAIECYNQQEPAGDHLIAIMGTITHPDGITINQPDGAHTLTITNFALSDILAGPGSTSGVDLITHESPGTLNVNNLTLEEASRGVVALDGQVNLNNATIQNNGQGLFNQGGSVTLNGGFVVDNTGDGIIVASGAVNLDAATVQINGATGVSVQSAGTATMTNGSTIAQNVTGIVNSGGSVMVTSSLITGNTQTGVTHQSGTTAISSSTVSDHPEGMFVGGGSLTLSDVTVTNNGRGLALEGGSTSATGGTITDGEFGVDATGGTLELFNVSVDNNTDSGIILMSGSPTVSLTNSDVTGNPTGIVINSGSVTVTDTSTVSNNTGNGITITAGMLTVDAAGVAENEGFGIFAQGGEVTVKDASIISENTAGIVAEGGIVDIDDSNIDDNGADGIVVDGATVTVDGSTVSANGANGVFVGGGEARVTTTTITGNTFAGVTVSGGEAHVTDSTVAGNTRQGVFVASGQIEISRSTITDSVDFDAVWLQGTSTATIRNSTIAGAVTALETGSSADVINSTVFDPDAFALWNQGSMSVQSSIIVGGCQAFEPIDDNGNNFAEIGNTTCGYTPLTPNSLDTGLADNGGPTETVALLAGSNAVSYGKCAGVLDGGGDLLVDQRGVARTPNVECDAGAFEVSCTNPFGDVVDTDFFSDSVIWAACNGITAGKTATVFAPTNPLTRGEMATFLWRFAGRPTGSPNHSFVDVPVTEFYSEPVKWLATTGITQGTGDGSTFSPNQTVTRGEMATFLWRFLGEPSASPGSDTFTDVFPPDFYDTPTGWLASTGITQGTGDGSTFSPLNPLNRSEAVTFLLRLAQWQVD